MLYFCILTASLFLSFFCFSVLLESSIWFRVLQTFTNAEQRFGYSSHFHNWRSIVSTVEMYLTFQLASPHARARRCIMQWLLSINDETAWSLAPTPPVITLAPSEPNPQRCLGLRSEAFSSCRISDVIVFASALTGFEHILAVEVIKVCLPFGINITNVNQQLLCDGTISEFVDKNAELLSLFNVFYQLGFYKLSNKDSHILLTSLWYF